MAMVVVVAVVFVTAPSGPPHACADRLLTTINMTVAGRISDNDSLNMYAIKDIATFESAGRAYAVVTSGEGMQMLDLTDPYNIVPAGLHRFGGSGIAIFKSADDIYAATISGGGMRTFNLTDPYNIIPAGHVAADDDGLALTAWSEIAIFELANRTYAIASLEKELTEFIHDSQGMPLIWTICDTTITQVIDLTDPYNVFRADRIPNDSYMHANNIFTFESSNRTYTVWVAGSVFVMGFTGQHTLVKTDYIGRPCAHHVCHRQTGQHIFVETDYISDSQDTYLGYAWHGDTFKAANHTYIAVTAYWEDGVQVLDLTNPYDIVPADGIGDEEDIALDGVKYIATFESANRHYAAVTSNEGVQVLDLTNPHNIVPITNSNDPGRTRGIDVFELAGHTYAVTWAYADVQVIQLTGNVADSAAYGSTFTILSSLYNREPPLAGATPTISTAGWR